MNHMCYDWEQIVLSTTGRKTGGRHLGWRQIENCRQAVNVEEELN